MSLAPLFTAHNLCLGGQQLLVLVNTGVLVYANCCLKGPWYRSKNKRRFIEALEMVRYEILRHTSRYGEAKPDGPHGCQSAQHEPKLARESAFSEDCDGTRARAVNTHGLMQPNPQYGFDVCRKACRRAAVSPTASAQDRWVSNSASDRVADHSWTSR